MHSTDASIQTAIAVTDACNVDALWTRHPCLHPNRSNTVGRNRQHSVDGCAIDGCGRIPNDVDAIDDSTCAYYQ